MNAALAVLIAIVVGETPPKIEECMAKEGIRDKHFCLAKTGKEEALPRFMEVRRLALEKNPDLDRGEYFDAAENAGLLAARTQEELLFDWSRNKDRLVRVFGIHALGHMLSTLDMGYAHGGDADARRFAALAPRVGETCKGALNDPDDVVVRTALSCLGETENNEYTGAVVEVMVKRKSAQVRRRGYSALRRFSRLSEKAGELRPLVRILEEPFEHKNGEVNLRADICGMLRGIIRQGETWPAAAAVKAVEHIADRSSQARDKCRELAKKAGTDVAATAPPKSSRNWFPDSDLEKCTQHDFGRKSLAMCAMNLDAGEGKRKFTIVFKDTSKLDKRTGDHRAVRTISVKTRPGEYMLYEQVVPWELSTRRHLVFVPIVKGVPDAYDGGRALFFVFDAKTKKVRQVWQSPECPSGCTDQQVTLTTNPKKKKTTVSYVQTVKGSRTATSLSWNGRKLQPLK